MRTSKKKRKRLPVVLLMIVMVFSLCGFSFEVTATLKHNGKGSAILNFESDKSFEEFEAALSEKIAGYNGTSAANTQVGGNEMLVVDSIEEVKNGYTVKIDFRRIDKIAASGKFEYQQLSEYLKNYLTNSDLNDTASAVENAINYRMQTLVKWSKGDLTGITVDALGMLLSCNEKEDNELKAIPQTISGEKMEIDEFIEEGKKAKDNVHILTFFLLGLDDVTSAQMTFPGKITHYAGENITIIGEDTVKIVPSDKTVQQRGTDTSVTPGPLDTKSMVGYIVYEESLSTGAITFIIAGILIAAGLLIWGYLYMVRKGKKAMEKQMAEKNASYFKAGVQATLQSETWKNVKRHKMLYVFVAPAVILLIVFNYAPMFGLAVSFQDYSIQEGVFGSEFVGLTMYKRLFTSYDASYRIFRNTIFIALIRIITNFPIILISTLFVNEIRNKKAKTLVTTVSYIPYFISWVAIGGMTHSLFAVDGIFNQFLTSVGMETINWYAEPDYWWPILTITSLWKGLGWSTLIYISGLGLINGELYEACKIDGGGKLRQALTVTIPGIINVIIMQLILDIGGIMSDNYDQIRALTKGSEAINDAVWVVGAQEFSTTMSGLYTEGAAYSLVRGIIGFALVLLTNKLAKSTDNEGIL